MSEKLEGKGTVTILIDKQYPLLKLFGNGIEHLRFELNGDIFIKNKLVDNDKEVVNAFREFLVDQGYLQKK
jgi:hypothetical protein